MEFRDVVSARRSVRHFRPDPVSRSVLERVIEAAVLAPSSMNLQPWRFHVTSGASREAVGRVLAQATVHLSEYVDLLGVERITEAEKWYSSLGNAPVVIGVSMPAGASGLEAVNTLISVGAALENLMLAATDEGLATCSITFAWWVREELAGLFGLPPDREVAALVAVGHPAGPAPAPPPRRTDVVDWLD